LPERSNRILFNEWVWLESQMYLGWLSAVLQFGGCKLDRTVSRIGFSKLQAKKD